MLKRILTGALSVLLAVCLLFTTACSTPDVAIRANDKDISMGEYLAYMYEMFYSVYYGQGMYQYASYGYDVWDLEFEYGEGDDAKDLKLDEYLRQTGKDLAIRQVAVAELLEKYGLTVDEKDAKELKKQLATVSEADLLKYGFNKKNYAKVVMAVELNEAALFYGLYDEGGEREVAEDDIRAYYEENYLSYKSIDVVLQDEKGKDFDEDQIAAVQAQLEGYLAMYEESGDFDAVIKQYEADIAEDKEETDTEETTDKEEEKTDYRVDTTVEAIADKNTSDAIKDVEIGKAAIQQYKVNKEKPTMSLILRLDPDKRDDEVDYYAEQHQAILQALKYEELDKEILDYVKKMDVEVNESAIKMADPKQFEG